MPQSRKRGGAKAHRRRIQKLNGTRQAQQTAMQKLFNESLKMQNEEMKKKKDELSGMSENS
jgi:hypothetical protein